MEQTAHGNTVFRSHGVMRNQNPQAGSDVRRSQSVLFMCQSVWPGAQGRFSDMERRGRSNSGNVSLITCCTWDVRHSPTHWLGNF